MTLMRMKALYPDLFYPQEWYEGEEFAHVPLDIGAYYIGPAMDRLPTAAEVVNFWITQHTNYSKIYWPETYVWTRDTDHDGNKVYVGGFELGHRLGLQIHRHLTNINAIDYTKKG